MIIHVDMDAFYASVEIRDNPKLKGFPVVVGGSIEGRGVVAAASYEARKYGVYSAMPAVIAKKKCPELVFLPVNMQKYFKVSEHIREIFYRYTPDVEPLALDEAFLDVSNSERLFGLAEDIGREIKKNIVSELDLQASVGIASNKFIAKIGSKLDKPDGFNYIPKGEEQRFLDPLPIDYIWGIGKKTVGTYLKLGIIKIKDIRQRPQQYFATEFGCHGSTVWELANGQDPRVVKPERNARSISHETTFASDIIDTDTLLGVLLDLTEQVTFRMRNKGLKGKTVMIKLRDDNFTTITRSNTLTDVSNSTSRIWGIVKALFLHTRTETKIALRLVGVGVTGFGVEEAQQCIFANEKSGSQNSQIRIDSVTDKINNRYGKGMIHRGRK